MAKCERAVWVVVVAVVWIVRIKTKIGARSRGGTQGLLTIYDAAIEIYDRAFPR